MMNRALTIFSFPAVFGALLLASPAAAQSSECQPGDLFCAEIRVGSGSAGVRIGGDAPPPPADPPTVIVQPAEPPPPPPVVVQPPPQPPTVIVQPAPQPPPPPVYAPPPQPVYVQPAQPRVVARVQHRDRFPYSSTGLHLHLDGLFGDSIAMGGGGAAFRIRPIPHVAIDLGASLYGGEDYNGLDRIELPFTADVLFFFNPQHRFQFYALLGIGGSFAHAEGYNYRNPSYRYESRDYAHLGGQLGIGLEWRISRVFALNLDVRGFVRERVDSNPQPEFQEIGRDGRIRSTDTSGGMIGRLGMTFYFGH